MKNCNLSAISPISFTFSILLLSCSLTYGVEVYHLSEIGGNYTKGWSKEKVLKYYENYDKGMHLNCERSEECVIVTGHRCIPLSVVNKKYLGIFAGAEGGVLCDRDGYYFSGHPETMENLTPYQIQKPVYHIEIFDTQCYKKRCVIIKKGHPIGGIKSYWRKFLKLIGF